MVGCCISAPAGVAGVFRNWHHGHLGQYGRGQSHSGRIAGHQGNNVKNSAWDGSKISIFGARNEVVAFNVILEAGSSAAGNVTVSFNQLTGPSGTTITSSSATGDGVFSWVGRNIELFYVRYLQIKGLSMLSYEPLR